MSKAQAKNKAKDKNPTKKTPNDPKLPSLIEIVPGKFNENDWNNMLEVEDNQEFVWEIIDEVFDNTLKQIHEKYLDKQTIPYTINEAKKAILHILDWQFLSKDVDDDLTEVWIEDEEPEACLIDSWAQGYVESIQIEEPTPPNSENNLNQTDDAKTNFLEELNRIINESRKTSIKSERVQKTPEPAIEKAKKTQLYKERKKKLDSIARKVIDLPVEPEVKKTLPREKNYVSEIKKLEEPISKAPVACHSILKTLLSRPLNLREIEIDADGNVQTIAKLDFDKAPMNNVKARFSVVPETKSMTNIDQMNKRKKITSSNVQIEEDIDMLNELETKKKSKAHLRSPRFLPSTRKSKSIYAVEENDYLLEPAPGVVFTMLNTTRAGPKRPNISNKQNVILERAEHNLRPVRPYDYNSNSLTRSSIDEILNSSSNVKAPVKLKPIPPINSSTAVN